VPNPPLRKEGLLVPNPPLHMEGLLVPNPPLRKERALAHNLYLRNGTFLYFTLSFARPLGKHKNRAIYYWHERLVRDR